MLRELIGVAVGVGVTVAVGTGVGVEVAVGDGTGVDVAAGVLVAAIATAVGTWATAAVGVGSSLPRPPQAAIATKASPSAKSTAARRQSGVNLVDTRVSMSLKSSPIYPLTVSMEKVQYMGALISPGSYSPSGRRSPK